MQYDLNKLPARPTDDNLRGLTNLFGAGPGAVLKLGAYLLAVLAATVRTALAASASFTRPSDTTAYASGDLVANSTTAGSVVPLVIKVARNATASAVVRRARLIKSSASLTNASFRVHLYSTRPTPANGDNGAWSTTNAGYIGAFDVTMDKAFTDGAQGNGVPNVGSEITLTGDADGSVAVLIEARGAYTPASGETFTVTLEGSQS